MTNLDLIKSLSKLADHLDSQDQTIVADLVDAAILKLAQSQSTYTDPAGVIWKKEPADFIYNPVIKDKVLKGTHNYWRATENGMKTFQLLEVNDAEGNPIYPDSKKTVNAPPPQKTETTNVESEQQSGVSPVSKVHPLGWAASKLNESLSQS